MAERLKADSDGDIEIAVHAGDALGSDDAMRAVLQGNALEMYLGGNVSGPLVPTMEMPACRSPRGSRSNPLQRRGMRRLRACRRSSPRTRRGWRWRSS